MLKHTHIFYLFTIVVFAQYGVKMLVGGNLLTQLDDIMLVGMAGLMVLSWIYEGGRSFMPRRTVMDLWISGAIAIAVISAILNGVPLMLFILSMKNYFLFFVVFYYLVYHRFHLEDEQKAIRFIFILFSIEFVIQLLQLVAAMLDGTLNSDSVKGTFPYANNMSYAYLFPLLYASYRFLMAKEMRYLKWACLFLLGMVLSMGRFSIIIFPLLFIVYNWRKLVVRKFFAIQATGVILLFIGANVLLYPLIGQSDSKDEAKQSALYMFDPNYWVTHFTENETQVWRGSARLLWYPITYQRLDEYAAHPSIGMGPGMYASFVGFNYLPPPAASIYNVFGQEEFGADVGVDSQIIPIWGEMGWIGIFIFLILFIVLAVRYNRIFKRAQGVHLKAMAFTASASSWFVLVGMYVNHIIETQPLMFLYFLFAGLTEVGWRRERELGSAT